VWIIVEDSKNELTQYLLGQLDEAGQEEVELRLLTDPAFSEEFDVVVDEIAIRYASGGFEGKEKDSVERYFLQAGERQDKAKVMCELLHRSATRPVKEPGLWTKLQTFWSNQPATPRFAVTLATVVIVVGIVFLARSLRPTTSNFATLTLTSTEGERDPGATPEVPSKKLEPGVDELRIELALPAQQTQPKSHRVELIVAGVPRDAAIVSQDARSVVISIPASELKPDRYAIRVFAVYEDGREERIPGSYVFRIE
jgi:hypothetical protein